MSFRNVPLGTPELFNVVLEIPKGSSNKYEYDEKLDVIKLDFVFTDGFHFPFDYGYLPETRGGDGDHLDVMLLSSYVLTTGTIIPSKAIGIIETLDRGEVDDKLVAIPAADPLLKKYQSIEDLPDSQIEEFKEFYKGLAIQKNKTVEIVGIHDRDRALEEIQSAHQNFSRSSLDFPSSVVR